MPYVSTTTNKGDTIHGVQLGRLANVNNLRGRAIQQVFGVDKAPLEQSNPTLFQLSRQVDANGIPFSQQGNWEYIMRNLEEQYPNPIARQTVLNQVRAVQSPRPVEPPAPHFRSRRRSSSMSIGLPSPVAGSPMYGTPEDFETDAMPVFVPVPPRKKRKQEDAFADERNPKHHKQNPIRYEIDPASSLMDGDTTPMVQSPILSPITQKKKRAREEQLADARDPKHYKKTVGKLKRVREEQLADARDIQHYSKNYKKTTIFGKLKPKIKRVLPAPLAIEESVVRGQAPMSPVPHLTAQKRKGSLIINPKLNKLSKQVLPQIEQPLRHPPLIQASRRSMPININRTFTSIPTAQQHQGAINSFHNAGRRQFVADRALVPVGRRRSGGVRVEEVPSGFVRPTGQDLVVRRRSVNADGSLVPIRRPRRNSRTDIIAQSQAEQAPSPSARSLRRLKRNARKN
jgi:ribosome assembly protein YihI (activator of Der GTPase)